MYIYEKFGLKAFIWGLFYIDAQGFWLRFIVVAKALNLKSMVSKNVLANSVAMQRNQDTGCVILSAYRI